MCYRQHRYDFIALVVADDHYHCTGAILHPFFLAEFVFPPPKVRIANYQTRNRLGECHDQPVTSRSPPSDRRLQ